MLGSPLLYMFYGWWIWHIRMQTKPIIHVVYLLIIHFGSSVFAWKLAGEDYSYFNKMLEFDPEIFYGGMFLFVMLFCIAIRVSLNRTNS